MELYLTATSSVVDLTIEFIEVRLKSGETVSLNWNESRFDRDEGEIDAHYLGVCFNEDSACGKLDELQGMQVVSVGLYSEEHEEGDYPIYISRMEFCENDKSLCFENPFSKDAPYSFAMQRLYDKFLASSRR